MRDLMLALSLFVLPTLAIAQAEVTDATAQTATVEPIDRNDIALYAKEGAAQPSEQLMEAVVVSGEQPGPGLWRVSKGDHFMWIIGTQYPLPKRMTWVSREVEQAIAESQEVLYGPKVELTTKIGWFKGMLLLPAALGSRKNPDKEKLVEIVPPDLYARWLPLKAKYIGRSNSIEKQRPLFAAQKLYEKAIKRNGLSNDSVVLPVIKKTAKKHKIPMSSPTIEIDIGDPKQVLRDFADTRLDDLDCFARTLERLESDLGTMRDRANAWATGDIDWLRRLPTSDQYKACSDAFMKSSISRDRGLDDLLERMKLAWLDAAEAAIAKNEVTFAVMSMSNLLNADGYLAALQARGYDIEEP